MCILLKLDYAKFGVSNLFFQKLLMRNICRPPPPHPLVKQGLKLLTRVEPHPILLRPRGGGEGEDMWPQSEQMNSYDQEPTVA